MTMKNFVRVIDFIFFSLLLFTPSSWTAPSGVGIQKNIELLMPDVQPTVADTYLCFPMNVESTFYITGFQPKADMQIAHHILLYGCEEPGNTDKVWNCGEMHSKDDNFERDPICREGSKIIYAWAMDAPELRLPDGVGFKVGDGTPIRSIVLQVHYKDVSQFLPPINKTDHSGVVLTTTDVRQPYLAGVYLMATDGSIPPHSVTYMETACTFNEHIEMHPFAFRTHTHPHGRVVAGYRIRDGVWTEIGRKNPQLPQMFYNVTTPGITVKFRDILAARCTMVNDENITVWTGSTTKDEMCNFYMMYFVNGDRVADNEVCISLGPPEWNWFRHGGIHPEKVPLDASMIPGTNSLLKSTQALMQDVEESLERQHQKVKESLSQIFDALRGYDSGYIDGAPEDADALDNVVENEDKRDEWADQSDAAFYNNQLE